MSNDLDIFAGPAQVTLYDTTNGYLHLGWCEARIKEKPKKTKSIENQTLLIENNFDFDVKVIRFNSDTLNKLSARNNTKQTIYLVGLDSMITINNVFIFYFTERPFGSKPHHLTIAASGNANLVSQQVNLIHPDGKFENDSNSDGLADGWVLIGSAPVSIQSSFLTGGGNCQRIDFSSASAQYYIYKQALIPFKEQLKVTASIYAKFDPDGTISEPRNLNIGLELRDKDNNWIASHYEYFSFNSGEQKRISITKTLDAKDKEALYVRLIIKNVPTDNSKLFVAQLDNAQLELGKLSNFKEY